MFLTVRDTVLYHVPHCLLACSDLWRFWHLPSLLGSLGPIHHTNFDSFLSLTGSASWFNVRIESVFSNKCPFVVTSPSYLLTRYNSTFFIWSLYFLKLSNWKVQLVPWHLQHKVWNPGLHRLLALNFITALDVPVQGRVAFVSVSLIGLMEFLLLQLPCKHPLSLGFFSLSFSQSSDLFIGLVSFLSSALSLHSVWSFRKQNKALNSHA